MSEEAVKVKVENDDAADVDEEYAYLDRGGFSSEKFKIEVRGLPKYYGIAEMKTLMNSKLGLNTSKIKRPATGSRWLYACFQNEEERAKAIATLNGFKWKGKTLEAYEALPAPDPLVRKRKQEEYRNVKNEKKFKEDEGKTQEERLKDAVTPYWRLPYDDQVELKEREMRQVLVTMENQIWYSDKSRRGFIDEKRKTQGISFKVLPIQKSPIPEGYRNKCEFTVGVDLETNLPTVGFRFGSYVTGTVAVAPVHSVNHITEKTKEAVLIFQDYVRNSVLPPFSPEDYTGYWRFLTVRHSSATDEIMLIISMFPQQLTFKELEILKACLVKHFTSKAAVACGIKSVYFETIKKKTSGHDSSRWGKPVLLTGSTHITDSILGLNFRISAQSFFQVNTAAATLLYQTAIEISKPRKDSTVVDICCGTGTIGLGFAKHCKKVIGLELVVESVMDAKANAESNNIDNCDFYAGKAEAILSSVLARASGDDIIAIVDPPRAGLHMKAIILLRNNVKIKRIVYISCSPNSAMKNFIDLCRPSSKTMRGAPFRPVCAAPVDMFPQTKHCELVLLLQRATEEDTKQHAEAGTSVQKENIESTESDAAMKTDADTSIIKQEKGENDEEVSKVKENNESTENDAAMKADADTSIKQEKSDNHEEVPSKVEENNESTENDAAMKTDADTSIKQEKGENNEEVSKVEENNESTKNDAAIKTDADTSIKQEKNENAEEIRKVATANEDNIKTENNIKKEEDDGQDGNDVDM